MAPPILGTFGGGGGRAYGLQSGGIGTFEFTITSATTDANLASLATAAGWNGSSELIATIDSGVYVSASTTANKGMTIDGSFPAGVTLINNGYIVGDGGNGGNGANISGCNCSQGGNGGSGGIALLANVACTIDNTNGVIGGGGGGGGGGGARTNGNYDPDAGWECNDGGRGGGGGGGQSGNVNSSGGTGQSNGNAGTKTAAGTGGTVYFDGGNGGSWGASGTNGQNAGGGNYRNCVGGSGGAGGAATSGNANITWTATGTRYGTIG